MCGRVKMIASRASMRETVAARASIGVPVLHLLEHENFDEQAGGGGEGITGL